MEQDKEQNIPSDIKILMLSFVHVFRIIALALIFIAPITFGILSFVFAFKSDYYHFLMYAGCAVLFHYSYSIVVEWFEENRIEFSKLVSIWSENKRD